MADRSLTEAVRGSRLAGLEAIRDKLATELESGGSQPAAVARELRAVLVEIDQLQPPKEGSRFDQLAARRAARIADAEDKPAAKRQRGGRAGGGRTS